MAVQPQKMLGRFCNPIQKFYDLNDTEGGDIVWIVLSAFRRSWKTQELIYAYSTECFRTLDWKPQKRSMLQVELYKKGKYTGWLTQMMLLQMCTVYVNDTT